MKLLIALLALIVSAAQADEAAKEECGHAVDAADSMNMNRKECDYSNQGLNGFLHRAFKKGEEGAVLETSNLAEKASTASETSTAGKKVAAEKNYESPIKGENKAGESTVPGTLRTITLEVELDQWANLPAARAQLLPKALEQCGSGFSVTGEHYHSLPMGRLKFALDVECR